MVLQLLHHTICGGLAAAGFGVLFNISFRGLPWCAAGGALALALRTLTLDTGWSMEAASFLAASALGFAVQVVPEPSHVSRNVLHVAGCIPLIPGALAAKAILGLFAITSMASGNAGFTLAMENTVRVALTMGALGTGVTIPLLLLRVRRVR